MKKMVLCRLMKDTLYQIVRNIYSFLIFSDRYTEKRLETYESDMLPVAAGFVPAWAQV